MKKLFLGLTWLVVLGLVAVGGVWSMDMYGDLDMKDNSILNGGDVAVDSISSTAGTSIVVTLGSDAGDDLLVDGTGLVYEGDNNRVGIGTASPARLLDVEASGTSGLVRIGRDDSGTTNQMGSVLFGNSTDGTLVSVGGIEDGANDAGALQIQTEATGGSMSVKMTVLGNGNVGIGTGSPGTQLHLQNASTVTATIESTGSAIPALFLDGDRAAADQTVGRLQGLWNGNPIGTINFISGPDTGNKDDGEMAFSTAAPGGAITERVRIDENGNVGIGTASPANLLEVETDADGVARFESTDDTARIIIADNGDDAYFGMSDDNDVAYFGFVSTPSATNLNIDEAGNVGIGTTSPGYPLEVTGNAYFSADVSALTFTDRTPFYTGDALDVIKSIKAIDGHINHTSLPLFAQSKAEIITTHTVLEDRVLVKNEDAWEDFSETVEVKEKDTEGSLVVAKLKSEYILKDGKIVVKETPVYKTKKIKGPLKKRLKDGVKLDPQTGELYTQTVTEVETTELVPGRDLGAMISILTKAVQQLTARLEAIEN